MIKLIRLHENYKLIKIFQPSFTGDFSVKVWDAITGSALHSFQHKHVVKSVDWSPNSKRLATAGNEGVLRVFDIAEPEKKPLEFVMNKDEVSYSYGCLYTLASIRYFTYIQQWTHMQQKGCLHIKMQLDR